VLGSGVGRVRCLRLPKRMPNARVAVFTVLASLLMGFIWGKVGAHSRIPKVVQFLLTPCWTAIASVVCAWCLALLRFASGTGFPEWLAQMPLREAVHFWAEDGFVVFVRGLLLGLPGIGTWALAVRRTTAASGEDGG